MTPASQNSIISLPFAPPSPQHSGYHNHHFPSTVTIVTTTTTICNHHHYCNHYIYYNRGAAFNIFSIVHQHNQNKLGDNIKRTRTLDNPPSSRCGAATPWLLSVESHSHH